MNLWDELMGVSVEPPPMPKGTPILCTCGRRIGVQTPDGDVWRAEYQHTAAGAAEVVIDVLLEDFELLAGLVKQGEWDGPDDAVDVIVSLSRLAEREGSSSPALAVVLPRLVVPARLYRKHVLKLDSTTRLRAPVGADLPAGCKKCRLVYDVREVVRRGVRNKRGSLLVGDCEPASVKHLAYTAPTEGLHARVDLYRRLCAVLSSPYSASLVGEASPVK